MTGSGTSGDPYVISTYSDLASIQSKHTSINQYFTLANDIDCQGATWTPLFGFSSTYKWFCGHINGNGYRIKNFVITSLTQSPYETTNYTMYAGFIGKMQGVYSSIQNIIFDNCTITLNESTYAGTKKYVYVGIVAAEVESAQVYLTKVHAYKSDISATFTSWNSSAVISIAGVSPVGVGTYNYCSTDQCNITVSTNTAAVRGVSVAGLTNAATNLNYCFTNVNIATYSPNGFFCSLLAKNIAATQSNNYARGTLSSTTLITESYFGSLYHELNSSGGVIDKFYTTITSLDTTKGTYKGLLAGRMYANATITSSFYDSSLANYSTQIGATLAGTLTGVLTAKTTSEMKMQSTFSGWNFTTIWAIDSAINDGYPYLIDNPPLADYTPPAPIPEPAEEPESETNEVITTIDFIRYDNEAFINTTSQLTLASTELGEISYDKRVNFVDIDYYGQAVINIYQDDDLLTTITLPYEESRQTIRRYIPLNKRKFKNKLHWTLDSATYNFKLYNLEIDYSVVLNNRSKHSGF